jgi:uncharacterized protein YerC
MNMRERYQKLCETKLQEYVEAKAVLEKLEKQLGLLQNWLAVEELESEAKALDVQESSEAKPDEEI